MSESGSESDCAAGCLTIAFLYPVNAVFVCVCVVDDVVLMGRSW